MLTVRVLVCGRRAVDAVTDVHGGSRVRVRVFLEDRAHVELGSLLGLSEPRRLPGGRCALRIPFRNLRACVERVDRVRVERVLLGRQILYELRLDWVVRELVGGCRPRYWVERLALLARNLRRIGAPASLQLKVF